jgi:hypothetical protein
MTYPRFEETPMYAVLEVPYAGLDAVIARHPEAFDERQRPVCGVWVPMLGPCICGNVDGHWECCGGKRIQPGTRFARGHIRQRDCDPIDDIQDHHDWDDASLATCKRCGTLSQAWEE